jgi:hypothetical protein
MFGQGQKLDPSLFSESALRENTVEQMNGHREEGKREREEMGQ